jgi:hypothetical protein
MRPTVIACAIAILITSTVHAAPAPAASEPAPKPTSKPAPAPKGKISLNGRALRDDRGPVDFTAQGVTYFPALHRAKHDRARFRSDLKFLSGRGFNYIRVLSMVGWYPAWRGKEIAPVAFVNKEGARVEAWPDYWRQLDDMIDIAYREFGIRTQLTIFADAQLMPDKRDRVAHLDKLLAMIRNREHKLILIEVANEAWQNGFPGEQGVADVRELGKYLADRTDVLVALSATEGMDNAALERMYLGSAADIATEHFSRDVGTIERNWLPVRDCFRVNFINGLPPASHNEPIGPGSSVAEERDPVKIVVAAAYAWMSGLPMYCYHPRAGIFGEGRLEEMPAVADFGFVRRTLPPDVANWRRTEGDAEFAPFVTFADGQPNKPWTDVPGAKTGALRHLSCDRGEEFYTLPIGILPGGVEIQARRKMTVEIFHPVTGKSRRAVLVARERTHLPQGDGAYLIRGRFTE